jgi:hypothetical protein
MAHEKSPSRGSGVMIYSVFKSGQSAIISTIALPIALPMR